MLDKQHGERKKCNQKKLSVEAIALRKMRELKGLNRKEAGALLGVSFKQIEKTENGRTQLSKEKIVTFLKAYGFTRQQFENICQGKMYLYKEKKVAKNKDPKRRDRRFCQKIITPEAKALASLRIKIGISQYEASKRCGYSKPAIGHIENGRIQLPSPRIEHIVKSYGFKMSDYQKEIKKDVGYCDMLKSCQTHIQNLDDEKLTTVYQLLKSFNQ